MNKQQKYCLDANVLIQAWQKYWSPHFCPAYWDILNQLGEEKRIFIPKAIHNEICQTEDGLASWLSNSKIPVHEINGEITLCLKKIYDANPDHQYIVSSNGIHSAGDPWLIAHAMNENSVIVTKEILDSYTKPTKIKIPHICNNLGIRYIDDFDFVKELEIMFSCNFKKTNP